MPDRLLPLFPAHPGGRSPITCEYRCGNACAHPEPNESGNEYFGDVVKDISRRRVFKAGAVLAAAAGGFAALSGTAAAAPAPKPRPVPGTDFDAVPPNKLDAVSVPDGYAHRVVIRWATRSSRARRSSTSPSRRRPRRRSSSATTTTSSASSRRTRWAWTTCWS